MGNQAPASPFHQYRLDRANTMGPTSRDLLETRTKEETVEEARDEEETNRDDDGEVLETNNSNGDDGRRDDQHSATIGSLQYGSEE